MAIVPPLEATNDDAIVPFRVDVLQSTLDDLQARLALTRWPDKEVVADWSQGAPLSSVKTLVAHWQSTYDWRRCEARLNAYEQFRTHIDGLGIHFLHVRSPHAGALPVIMTHGWPGSVVEFLKVIDPLINPTAHGGAADQAFHVVIPSLPGYGFSDKPAVAGWTVERIAAAWHVLMQRLGYDRYVAQGGDWGSAVTRAMALLKPKGLIAIHLNMVICFPEPGENLSGAESQEATAAVDFHKRWGMGYSVQQSTRPQTLGYGLADSPVGQAAWIYEKFHAWTQNQGTPESVLSRDEMLDNIMLYWLTNSATSAARLYWESFRTAFVSDTIDLPAACTIYPGEMRRPPRRWAERVFSNIIHWNRVGKGGHFAAFEQPAIFVDELRAALKSLR